MSVSEQVEQPPWGMMAWVWEAAWWALSMIAGIMTLVVGGAALGVMSGGGYVGGHLGIALGGGSYDPGSPIAGGYIGGALGGAFGGAFGGLVMGLGSGSWCADGYSGQSDGQHDG